MINTYINNERINDPELYFADRSYPSERTRLEVDVFQLELSIRDYEQCREAAFDEDICWEYAFDEQEMLRAAENELSRKRERLAFLMQ